MFSLFGQFSDLSAIANSVLFSLETDIKTEKDCLFFKSCSVKNVRFMSYFEDKLLRFTHTPQ